MLADQRIRHRRTKMNFKTEKGCAPNGDRDEEGIGLRGQADSTPPKEDGEAADVAPLAFLTELAAIECHEQSVTGREKTDAIAQSTVSLKNVGNIFKTETLVTDGDEIVVILVVDDEGKSTREGSNRYALRAQPVAEQPEGPCMEEGKNNRTLSPFGVGPGVWANDSKPLFPARKSQPVIKDSDRSTFVPISDHRVIVVKWDGIFPKFIAERVAEADELRKIAIASQHVVPSYDRRYEADPDYSEDVIHGAQQAVNEAEVQFQQLDAVAFSTQGKGGGSALTWGRRLSDFSGLGCTHYEGYAGVCIY